MVWLFAHWFTVTDQIYYHSTMIWERYYVITTHRCMICSVLEYKAVRGNNEFCLIFSIFRTTQWPTWTWLSTSLNNIWTFQRCWTLKVRKTALSPTISRTLTCRVFCSVLCVLSRFDWSGKTRWKSYYDLRIMLLSCIQWSTKGKYI